MPPAAATVLCVAVAVILLSSSTFLLGASSFLRLIDMSDAVCRGYDTCASCAGSAYFGRPSPLFPPACVWCPVGRGYCVPASSSDCPRSSSSESGGNAPPPALASVECVVAHEYSCPLSPRPYPDEPPPFLPDWMGRLLGGTGGRFGRSTLLELSLPGTHDSLTYDLSLTVSEDGLDGMEEVGKLLHSASGGTVGLMPGELEEFFRLQAKTQQLTVTQQLDNGVRFLDVRITTESETGKWFGVHFMQTTDVITDYMSRIREWMEDHPGEVVVMWLSREGDATARGRDQYPGAATWQKRKLWNEIMAVFDGVVLDARLSPVNSTTMAELVRRNHRLVVYASDYEQFTGSSPFAIDGALVENFWMGDAVYREVEAMDRQRSYLRTAAERNRRARARGGGGFTLMSMNTAGRDFQVEGAAIRRFLPWPFGSMRRRSCAARTNIPGLTDWCPDTLLDVAQLTTYYDQAVLEGAYRAYLDGDGGTAFPNAFYLDALDFNGTVRTGTQTLFGAVRGGDADDAHRDAAYAYVDTVVAYNIHKACAVDQDDMGEGNRGHFAGPGPEPEPISVGSAATMSVQRRLVGEDDGGCAGMMEMVEGRRARYPLKLWSDPEHGRRDDWP